MKTDTNKVIKEIIGRGVEFFDYTKLDKGAWRSYYNDAKSIAANEVFNNEIRHYITDLLKFIGYESQNFEQVLHTRTAIVTLETLRDRLESIENPDTNKVREDEFSPLW